MRLPAYPKYKPSGVEWLGDVPEHWAVGRMRWSVSGIYNGVWGDEPDGVNDITCIRVADFDRETFRVIANPPTVRAVDQTQRKNRLLRQGDLLIEKSGGGEQQLVGCVVYFDHDFDAVCSNFVARLPVARGMHSRYWSFVHAAMYDRRLNYPAIKQTTGIQNLDSQAYFDQRVAFPPSEEQRAIAEFLDAQTAKLDTLVAKKQTLIEKLKEKRTALISRTVTRGLPSEIARTTGVDPDPKLKPSGAEWIGNVPDHWEIKPVKFAARVGNGSTPNRENADYWSDGVYPWLNSSVVNQEQVIEAREFVTDLALSECHLPKIKPPAVLIGITGQGKTRGMATTLLIEATINQHLAYLKPLGSALEVRYLRRVLDRAYLYLRSESDGGGSTKGAITCEQIASMRVPVPPVQEQRAIADYLDRETAKINQMIAKVEAAIARLQEYRTALITAAVTGKIDVRSTTSAHEAA